MQNIIPVDFIDVSQMTAALLMKHAPHFADDTRRQEYAGSPHHDTQTILLRGPVGIVSRETWFQDVLHDDADLLASWPSARRVIQNIAEQHRKRSGVEPRFGKIMVVQLKAGGYIDWHRDEGSYATAYDRFHVCMIPAPGAWLYSGGEAAMLPVGQLTWFNNQALHSAINGPVCARTHLIVDVRKPAVLN